MRQRGKATLRKLSDKRDGAHPFPEEQEILFLLPPALGMPFMFGSASGNGGGNTSLVVAGSFEHNSKSAVWTFRTQSGSEYQLRIEYLDAEPDLPAGGIAIA